MRLKRIELDECLFPVQAFFNALSDDEFIRVIGLLSNRVGYHPDYCHCYFPEDLDPGEELFEGVCFSIFEDKIVISLEELNDVIRLACAEYVSRNPVDEGRVKEILDRL